MEEGYLYLATETSKRTTKIGITKDEPSKRETALNGTRMPMEVKIFKLIKSPYYEKAEAILHKMYESVRIKSTSTGRYTEWFELDPMDVVSLCLLTSSDLKALCTSKKKYKSAADLLTDGRNLFLKSDASYIESFMSEKQEVIDEYKEKVVRLENEKDLLNEKIRILALQAEGHSANQKIENTVRTALRSLAHQ